MSNPSPSDLEIYVLKSPADNVRQWLADTLGAVEVVKSGKGSHHWRVAGMDVFYNEQVEANFSCLWFKQNQTPWSNDLECARSAHAALETEIRCAAVQWAESENDDQPGWVKITRGQEKPFDWN